MKKLVFNDSRQIEVQSVSGGSGTIHIRMILTSIESLKALFGDTFATSKMSLVENIKVTSVYENYTIFKYVKEESGGIFEVEMCQAEADDKTRLASVEQAILKVTKGDADLFERFIQAQAQTLPDEQALQFVEFAPEWNLNAGFSAGQRVNYNGTLYKCLQSHTSQASWTPEAAPSLWAKVLVADPAVISAWTQPDSTNGYSTGDKVTHNGKTWESLVDSNVWEPGATGSETLWIEFNE